MKRYLTAVLGLALGAVTIASQVTATNYTTTVRPGMGIKGTAHDLSIVGATSAGRANKYGSNDTANAYLPGGDLDRICIWCHAPHHTYKSGGGGEYGGSVDYYPLWNHTVTSKSYSQYNNGPDDPDEKDASDNPINHALSANLGQPGSVSKLCLSCHDGTVAVNEYGFTPGDTMSSGARKGDTKVYISDQYKIGADGNLANHHPIGFNYADVASSDDEIAPPEWPMTPGNTIGSLLWAGKMECTTCHDVHNTKNTGEKFLWKSDVQSEFCLTCHLKADVKK